VLYGFGLLLGRLGYNLSGLQVPLPAVAFLWWLSMIIDALLLQLFLKGKDRKQLFLCSIIMNTVSYLFLYVIVSYDH
jgi:Na+/melibiose symporter-like transporter